MAHLRIVGNEDQIRRLVSLLPQADYRLNRADPHQCRLYIDIDDGILEEWISVYEEDPTTKDQLGEMLTAPGV